MELPCFNLVNPTHTLCIPIHPQTYSDIHTDVLHARATERATHTTQALEHQSSGDEAKSSYIIFVTDDLLQKCFIFTHFKVVYHKKFQISCFYTEQKKQYPIWQVFCFHCSTTH